MYRIKQLKAFTLIELLVVIAIIGILAAILFPVFAKVREKARQVSCLSNEKQIGIAMLAYTQDYDEAYPLGEDFGSNTDWSVIIQPYLKSGSGASMNASGGVMHCPSFPNNNGANYIVRADVFPSLWGVGNMSGPSITNGQIDSPSNKIALYEVGANGTNNWGFRSMTMTEWAWASNKTTGADLSLQANHGDCDLGNGNPGCGSYPRYRHNGTCNFLYLDGHAKAVVKGRLDWYNDVYLPNIFDGGSIWFQGQSWYPW